MSPAPSVAAPPEARTLAPFGRRVARVAHVEELGAYRLLRALDLDGPPDPRPGQFYMLAAASGWGGEDGRPYLPRALSHCRVTDGRSAGASDEAAASVDFLLDAVGPGTARLAALEPGEELWLAGPFGVGFRFASAGPGGEGAGGGAPVGASALDPVPGGAAPVGGASTNREAERSFPRPVLVGGGIGVAPILALADELGPAATILLGFRSAPHAAAAALFGSDARLATDDGSAGRRALVTDLLREELDRDPHAAVYACGPPPMLEAVRALCELRGVAAQLALESGMACGYGACFGCVVPTRDGFVRLCLDGPVIDAARLETALFAGSGH